MTTLLATLEKGPLLLDGGLGSMLIAQGMGAGESPEGWVLEHPEQVLEVHRAYALAGAQVLHTTTFGASPPRLAETGLEGRCAEV